MVVITVFSPLFWKYRQHRILIRYDIFYYSDTWAFNSNICSFVNRDGQTDCRRGGLFN